MSLGSGLLTGTGELLQLGNCQRTGDAERGGQQSHEYIYQERVFVSFPKARLVAAPERIDASIKLSQLHREAEDAEGHARQEQRHQSAWPDDQMPKPESPCDTEQENQDGIATENGCPSALSLGKKIHQPGAQHYRLGVFSGNPNLDSLARQICRADLSVGKNTPDLQLLDASALTIFEEFFNRVVLEPISCNSGRVRYQRRCTGLVNQLTDASQIVGIKKHSTHVRWLGADRLLHRVKNLSEHAARAGTRR